MDDATRFVSSQNHYSRIRVRKHPNRKHGKTQLTALIESISTGVPNELEELQTLGER